MNRIHKFIQLLVILPVWFTGSSGVQAEEPVKILAGPMVIPQGDTAVMIWFQTNRPANITCHWKPRAMPQVKTPLVIETLAEKRCIGLTHYLVLPRQTYHVELRENDAGEKLPPLAKFHFKTPPPRGDVCKLKLAFGSCAHQEKFAEHQPIWKAITDARPDCFLSIGDNIYLPSKPEEFPATRDEVLKLYRDDYDKNRQMPELQNLLRSTVCYALWDDHDFGPNNCNRTWQWKDVALQALHEYFPNNYGLPDAPGCFYKFSWGDVDVFMLDDRTYRDPNDDPQRKTMFGEKQLAWLKDGLSASKATFKLIVNGNEMLSDKHPHESWGVQFRPERDEFLSWLWSKKIDGVIFLAGDRHFAELTRKRDPKGAGPDLWELTSSPLANEHYAEGTKFEDPDRMGSYIKGVNFGLLKFDTTASPPTVELTVRNEKGETVIERVLKNK